MKKHNKMKKLIFLIAGIAITAVMFAQSPNSFKYQAVVRDASGEVITGRQVTLVISILQGDVDGDEVFTETHDSTTNAYGLVTLNIGEGNPTDFASIDWSAGPYFVKIEMDGNVMGISQLLSVPYAQYAEKAGNVFSGSYSELTDVPANMDIDATDDFSGNYGDLTGTPDLSDTANYLIYEEDPFFTSWDKDYNDLINIPAQWDSSYTSIKDAPFIIDSITNVLDTTNQFIRVEQDDDPLNEIQTISRAGTTVTLSKGGGSYTDSVNVYTAGTGIDITDNVISTSGHYIGEIYGGGIVFWVTPDGQHGLIASLEDLNDGNTADYSNLDSTAIGESAQSMTDGYSNTQAIISQAGHTNSAAQLCVDYRGGGYDDWYLPSNREFYLLGLQDFLIDFILDNDGNPDTHGFTQEFNSPAYSMYWTSTEFADIPEDHAYHYAFSRGTLNGYFKNYDCFVRAIRAF